MIDKISELRHHVHTSDRCMVICAVKSCLSGPGKQVKVASIYVSLQRRPRGLIAWILFLHISGGRKNYNSSSFFLSTDMFLLFSTGMHINTARLGPIGRPVVRLMESIKQHFWAPCKAPKIMRRLARRRKIHGIMAFYVRAPCKAPQDKCCLIDSLNSNRLFWLINLRLGPIIILNL